MSFVTSTKNVSVPTAHEVTDDAGLRPWHFFLLAALACATAITWLARAQGFTAVILLTILMGTVALAALATLRTLAPLVAKEEDRTPMVGERTRAALEREKLLTLRAIKELEFDHAMKKLSEADYAEMGGRLRRRAARLIRQLDAGGGYRDRIEKDLAKRLGEPVEEHGLTEHSGAGGRAAAAIVNQCAACATANDPDARFCKSCGAKL